MVGGVVTTDSTSVEEDGGNAGSIVVRAKELNLQDGGRMSSVSLGRGDAGSVDPSRNSDPRTMPATAASATTPPSTAQTVPRRARLRSDIIPDPSRILIWSRRQNGADPAHGAVPES